MMLILIVLLVLVFMAFRGVDTDNARWNKIRYFTKSEFDSKGVGEKGTGKFMKHDFMVSLDGLREVVGEPLYINSGFRTDKHNIDIRGRGYASVSNSAHTKGRAADIHCRSLSFLKLLVSAARSQGFKRIGQYYTKNGNYFVHIDNDKTKAYQGEWAFYKGQKVNLFV